MTTNRIISSMVPKSRTRRIGYVLSSMLFAGFVCSTLQAAPSPIGTGLLSDITLGALQDASVVNRAWDQVVNYDFDLQNWRYDLFVPESYDLARQNYRHAA